MWLALALAVIEARVCGRVFNLFSCYVPLVMCEYPSTAKVWHTLNIGKSPRVTNNLIISGAVHGQMAAHCLGVVCQTLPVLR